MNKKTQILELAASVLKQNIPLHSPQGNFVAPLKEANKETEGHKWQAEQHKAAADKHETGTKKWHAAMAAHHESMAEYHASNGHHNLAAKHDDKANDHLDMMHSGHHKIVQEDEIIEEGFVRYPRTNMGGGHVHGRHYTDEHGVTHDDEGYSSDGNGPADRRERALAARKPATTKHYHEVPYKDKEHAKGEGMKWDGDKRKWYHTNAGKSATSKFKKLHEEVLDEAEDHHIPAGHVKISKSEYDSIKKKHEEGVEGRNSSMSKTVKSPKGTMVHKDAIHVSIDDKHGVVSRQTYSHKDHGIPSVWQHNKPEGDKTHYYTKKFHEEVLDEGFSKKEHNDLLNHIKSAGYDVTYEIDAAKDKDRFKDSKDHRVWLKHKSDSPHDKAGMREHMHDKFQAFGGDSHNGYELHGQHGNTKWSLRSLPKEMHKDEGHVMFTSYPAKKLHEEEVLDEESKRTPAKGTAARAEMDRDYDKAHSAAKKAGHKPYRLGYSHDHSHVNVYSEGGTKTKYNLASGKYSKGHHLQEEVLDEALKFNHRTAAQHKIVHPDVASHHASLKKGSEVDFYKHNTEKTSGVVHAYDGKTITYKEHGSDGTIGAGKAHKFTVKRAYPGLHEEVLDEAALSKNTGHGYHYEMQLKHNSYEKAHAEFSRTHSKVKKIAAEAGHLKDAKKPNEMVRHYLDSKHGRHLAGNEHDHEYIKKDFGRFAKHYKPELHEMFNQGTGHSESNSDKPKGHLISVTVSDPNHPAVSMRDKKTEKRIRVKSSDKEAAMEKAKSHYKKSGYKVHDVNHVKHLWEEFETVVLAEEHSTQEQANKAMEKHQARHPNAKFTTMQGRRTGKWHVVRHTTGGMHVVESAEEVAEDCGLDSAQDLASKKAAVGKKADEMPKVRLKEGDESEADYQAYLKTLHKPVGLKTSGLDPKDPKTFNPGSTTNRAATIKSVIKKGRK